MHYWGWWQRTKGTIFQQPNFSWGLRHLWIACSLWFVCDFMSLIIVDYPGFLSSFADISGLEYTSVSRETANITLLFFTGCLVFTIGLMKRSDFIQFLTTSSGIGSAIATGFGLAMALRVVLVLYSGILTAFDISLTSETSTISTFTSIIDSIISVNQHYSPSLGFIMVVILVPFYDTLPWCVLICNPTPHDLYYGQLFAVPCICLGTSTTQTYSILLCFWIGSWNHAKKVEWLGH